MLSRWLTVPLLLLCCGFQTLDLHWSPPPPPRRIVLRILTTGMTDAMVARIQDAAAMWASPAVSFVLTTVPDGQVGSAGTIALGTVIPQGSARTDHYGSAAGIVACSIVLDVEHGGPWSFEATAPAEGLYDFQTAMAHELGHCLGLNHTSVTEGQPVMGSHLHAGGTGGWRRVLAPDDVAGRDSLFPVVKIPPPAAETRRSGCSVFGG